MISIEKKVEGYNVISANGRYPSVNGEIGRKNWENGAKEMFAE